MKLIQQQDHIILPKATLKRFADKSNFISVLELPECGKPEIKKHRARSFHTQIGYYNVDIDSKIKKIETEIGMWNQRLTKSAENGEIDGIDFEKLKKFAIKLINLQFHRCIMADTLLRQNFIKYEQERYNKLSYNFFTSSNYSKNIILKKKQFEDATKNEEKFIRFFQEKYLLSTNKGIEKTYENFNATIMYIPDNVDSTFMLPPQHFVGTDSVARIILNPKLAIGLYKNNTKKLCILSENDVYGFAARSIESALIFSSQYREIVGQETYLNTIKENIKQVDNATTIDPVKNVLIISKNNDFCINDNNILNLVIFVKYLYPKINCIVIDSIVFSTTKTENYSICAELFQKYGYKVVFVFSNDDNIPNLKYKSFKNTNDAINFISQYHSDHMSKLAPTVQGTIGDLYTRFSNMVL